MKPHNLGRGAVCLVFFLTALLASAQAGRYPSVETTLGDWDGPKTVILRTDQSDPLASPLIQDLVELFLGSGFEVELGAADAPPGEGLVVDVRGTADLTVLVMSRGSDMEVLTLRRLTGEGAETPATSPAPAAAAASQSAPERTAPPAGDTPQRWSFLPRGLLALDGRPRGLVVLGQAEDHVKLALLLDDRLQLAQLSATGITWSASFQLTEKPTRGLRIGAADLDQDGTLEVAGLWAEDFESIYEGVDSRLHSWIFHTTGDTVEPISGDLKAHIRVVAANAYTQKRGDYSLFAGPVRQAGYSGKSFRELDRPITWGGRDLFHFTPLDATLGLARAEGQRLRLVAPQTGAEVPGGLLLEDFGNFRGPQIAVRLETPEFRSGFEKEDRINEKHHSLPPRIAVVSDQIVYTTKRGRTKGVPLVGKPKGKDAVVKIVREGSTLRLERPFAAVDAFILDFALLRSPGLSPAVLLLLNDKEDGSGAAHLLFQPPN